MKGSNISTYLCCWTFSTVGASNHFRSFGLWRSLLPVILLYRWWYFDDINRKFRIHDVVPTLKIVSVEKFHLIICYFIREKTQINIFLFAHLCISAKKDLVFTFIHKHAHFNVHAKRFSILLTYPFNIPI